MSIEPKALKSDNIAVFKKIEEKYKSYVPLIQSYIENAYPADDKVTQGRRCMDFSISFCDELAEQFLILVASQSGYGLNQQEKVLQQAIEDIKASIGTVLVNVDEGVSHFVDCVMYRLPKKTDKEKRDKAVTTAEGILRRNNGMKKAVEKYDTVEGVDGFRKKYKLRLQQSKDMLALMIRVSSKNQGSGKADQKTMPKIDLKKFDPMVADYNKYHQVFVSGKEWILSQPGYDSAEVNKLYFGLSFCLAYDMAKKCLALARGGEKYNQQLMEKIIDCAVNRIFGIYKEKGQKEKKDTLYFFAHVLLNSLSGETFAVVRKVTRILSKKFKSINVNDIFPDEFLNMDADDDHVFDGGFYNNTYRDWRERFGIDFAVMMLRYNKREQGSSSSVMQVSPGKPLDHKSSPAMLLASSMPFLAAVSSFAARKEESTTDTGDFLPDVFSQGMQEAEEQVTEQSKIYLAELDALLSGKGDVLFNKLSSEYEGHGAKCIKRLDTLINEGGIIEATALGHILIDKLQGIEPKLREGDCSEEQIASVELLVEKDMNEICKLMKKLGEVRVESHSFG